MSLFGSEHWMYSSGAAGFYDTEIDGSLRFNDDDSAHVSRTPSTSSNRRTWTFSCWFKRSKIGGIQNILTARAGTPVSSIKFEAGTDTSQLTVFGRESSSTDYNIRTSMLFRDVSAWYHLVVVLDTPQATASNRLKIYINGEQITDLSATDYPSQNFESSFNTSGREMAFGEQPSIGEYFDGYIADAYLIDGTALDPTSFGETKSGVWIPKAYSGSYGTNGFHLEFAGNANDSSGNGNNFTANNIAASDYLLDSPTNNFAVLNFLAQDQYSQRSTLAEGNLRATGTDKFAAGNFQIPSSGKWYFEMRAQNSANANRDGFGLADVFYNGSADGVYYSLYRSNGIKTTTGGEVSYGSSWTTGDILGCAVDADAGTVIFYKNGTSQGTAYTGFDFANDAYFPTVYTRSISTGANLVANFGQDSTFAGGTTAGGNSDANGYGDFKYSVPSGYLALCTANLTVAEAVDPASNNSPQDYFGTVLYSGNSSTNAISGVGFQPDFVWMKGRTNSSRPTIVDAVRSISKSLATDTTNAEITHNSGKDFLSFDSDGFTLGTPQQLAVNNSGQNYVAWNLKANGSGSSNTDGSITSTVSANTDAGFSIVAYTGTGSVGTVGHGLNSAPEFFMCKNRDFGGENWTGYSAPTGNTKKIELNTSNAAQTTSNWNNTSPTSSVFTLGANDNSNRNGNAHIAYCFHSVEGFSKIGSYTGNGSTDGSFVYTGFRPSFVMVKSYTAGEHWNIPVFTSDTNGAMNTLSPNLSNAERTMDQNPAVDFVSNGFKIRTSDANYNSNGGSYIYMAFAENPFKYANAR